MNKETSSEQSIALQVKSLSKTYKTGFWFAPKINHALKNLDLEVYENQAFGLLGLNGAGKTTVIKLILGLLKPSSGEITLMGGRISSRKVRSQIGYLSELPYFSKQHTGKELLNYFGALHGLSGLNLKRRVDEILELVRMTQPSNERVSSYSKGMLQRIGIGQALIGKPRLLICDEPMSGLDPVGYKEMRDIFIDLKRLGTTLFLNTHIMDEVERICDRIGILHEGHLKEVVPVTKILQSSVPIDYWIDVDMEEGPKLTGMPFEDSVRKNGGIQITGIVLAETLALLSSRKAKIKGVRPLSSLVEAYFLQAIGANPEFTDLKKEGQLKKILTVTLFTFRELIRSKMLFVWLISVVVLCGLDFLLSILSFGNILDIFMDLGLVGIEASGIIVLLLSLAVTYTTEMDQKAIYLTLAKPITRGEYLLGRVFGFFLVNSMVMLGMGLVIVGMVIFVGGGTIPAFFYWCVIFLLLEMFVLTVLGLTFQMIGTSMVGVVLYTFFTIFLGHLVGEVQWLLTKQLAYWVKILLKIVYYCLPNLEIFNLKDRIYDPTFILGWSQWEEVLLYTFTYSFLAFLLGWINLEKREFR